MMNGEGSYMKPLLALVLTLLGVPAAAQVVGGPYDGGRTLEGFANTPAVSFDELAGRLILVENFAYW